MYKVGVIGPNSSVERPSRLGEGLFLWSYSLVDEWRLTVFHIRARLWNKGLDTLC